MSNGNGNTTAAGAKIKHIVPCAWRQFFERGIDQRFRIRARDQYVRRDAERESKKFPPADQIGDRFAGATALNEFAENSGDGRIGRLIAVRQKPRAGDAQRKAEQDLRFPPGLDRVGQIACCLVEQAVDSRVHACTANVSSAIAASSSV